MTIIKREEEPVGSNWGKEGQNSKRALDKGFLQEESECLQKNAGLRNLQPGLLTPQQSGSGSEPMVSQLLFSQITFLLVLAPAQSF